MVRHEEAWIGHGAAWISAFRDARVGARTGTEALDFRGLGLLLDLQPHLPQHLRHRLRGAMPEVSAVGTCSHR